MKACYRSLVVDDQPFVRAIIREMMLHLKVFQVVEEARDGREAWNMIQEQPFDLVICDIDMPRMDGLELLKLVSENEDQDIAFVMISGSPKEEIIKEALKWGAKGFLPKPFAYSSLKSKVEGILRVRKARGLPPRVSQRAAIA